MKIGGLQKTTLLDFPGKIACTIFLKGCNLRCPFCHNAPLVLPDAQDPGLNEQDLYAFLNTRKGRLDGVCVSGGEPTLYADLPRLLSNIKDLGFLVKLDTNGTNPSLLRELLANRFVDYVAMDIKNSPENYALTCGGVDLLDAVRESVELLMRGSTDYEFRTTLAHPLHSVEDMESIGRWLHGAKKYYLQQFVDSGNLIGSGMTPLHESEMEAMRTAVLPHIPHTFLRGL